MRSSRPDQISPNRTYIGAVDQLRASFAILVLFYHGLLILSDRIIFNTPFHSDHWLLTRNPAFAVIVEGHSAVGAFMVLSGFIFMQGTIGKTIDYRTFLRNRILRIYPLYLTLIFFGACVHARQFSLTTLVEYVLPLATFAPEAFGSFGAMAWAVAVECQFYLLFPLLLTLLHKHGCTLFVRFIVLALALRLAAVMLGGDAQEFSYWTIAGRIDQFLIGMLAGQYFARRPTPHRSLCRQFPIAAALTIALLYGLNHLGGWPVHAWWRALWPTAEGLAWAYFIVTYVDFADVIPTLISRPIELIGRASYSIYLLHPILLEIVSTRRWLLTPFLNPFYNALATTLFVVLPLTLAMATLSFTTIEAPFLALRSRYVVSPRQGPVLS